MAKEAITSKQIMTPEFRVGFPNIWFPDINGRYGLTMMFDKATFNAAPFQEILKEVIDQVQTSVYKGNPIPPAVRVNPVKDGDLPNTNGKIHFKGYYTINASSKFQPGLVDAQVQPIIDQKEFYPGCYARAKVHAYWYSANGNNGIAICLGNVQKTRDGQRMGGGKEATEDFDVYVDPNAAGTENTSAGNIMNL